MVERILTFELAFTSAKGMSIILISFIKSPFQPGQIDKSGENCMIYDFCITYFR